MNCISKDTNKCVLDNVSMLDDENGNFGANFDDPISIAEDITQYKQQLISNKYMGGSIRIDAQDLVELFKEFEGTEPGKFKEDEDDGMNIELEEDEEKPWEMLDPEGRRRRL